MFGKKRNIGRKAEGRKWWGEKRERGRRKGRERGIRGGRQGEKERIQRYQEAKNLYLMM